MKAKFQTIHCVLENNPAWPVGPVHPTKPADCTLPQDPGADPLTCHRDWGPLLERYHKGDKKVFQLLCCRSKPLVDKISRKQYYAKTLGRDEAYSIAAMSMVNFWNRKDLTGNTRNLPGLLYHTMECDLINQIDRQNTRRRREVHYETDSETEGTADEWQDPLADSRYEPEEQALQNDWNRRVRDCLQYLGKKERQVIHGFFFRQLSVTEIAKEMECSPDSVTSAKRHALKRLRSIFAEQQIV